MQIITLSGVDGSGKSTQAQRLIALLEHNGVRTYYLHAVQFSIAQKILRRRTSVASRKRDAGTSQTRAGMPARLLRVIALCIDIGRFALLRHRLARHGYGAIVSDRFFFDTVVNIRYLAATPRIGLLERIVPRAQCALFLSVPPQKIMTRERAPEQGLRYLQKKTTLFTARQKLWHMTTIDGDASPDIVFERILQALAHCNAPLRNIAPHNEAPHARA